MAKKVEEFLQDNSDVVKELERQLKEKEKIINDIQIGSGQLELLFSSLLSQITSLNPQAISYNPKKESGNHLVMPVFQDSDWHIGEYQDADEIEGINSFSYPIAVERVNDLTHRENRIIDRFRAAYTIRDAVLIDTGDKITGDLRDEAKRTNDLLVPEQVVKAAELSADRYLGLAQNLNHLRIEYFTADNHGRLMKKPESKDKGINSFNYLVAKMIEKILARQNNIEFKIRTEPQGIVHVENLQYLCMHGDQIRAWSGHAWYGWDRKVGKESKTRLDLIMENPEKLEKLGYNKIVAGHFHEPLNTVHFAIAGSLMGTSAYDRDNGRYSKPSQPMWFVDPKYGEFGRIDFRL